MEIVAERNLRPTRSEPPSLPSSKSSDSQGGSSDSAKIKAAWHRADNPPRIIDPLPPDDEAGHVVFSSSGSSARGDSENSQDTVGVPAEHPTHADVVSTAAAADTLSTQGYRRGDFSEEADLRVVGALLNLKGGDLQSPKGYQPENPNGPDPRTLLGAELHSIGQCSPCSWFWQYPPGCSNGAACKFCHVSGHPKLNRKFWKQRWREKEAARLQLEGGASASAAVSSQSTRSARGSSSRIKATYSQSQESRGSSLRGSNFPAAAKSGPRGPPGLLPSEAQMGLPFRLPTYPQLPRGTFSI